LSRLRIGTDGGLCESGDEFFGSIKCEEFLDWLKKDSPLRKGYALWSQLLTYIKCYIHQYVDYCI
jgi:hypothetical protein